MNKLSFPYEKNGFTVSKLNVHGFIYYIVNHKESGKRYIRKSLTVVNAITGTSSDDSSGLKAQ